jgi:hypothetical protein
MTSSANAKVTPAMAVPVWEDIPEASEKDFALARMEALNLVQWLARIANSYVTNKMPEERVVLEFRSANPAFVTQPFEKQVTLEMRLADLEMQFSEYGRPVPHIFNPEEHSPAKVEAWLLVELLHRGIDRSKFSKKLPYPMPNLMTGDAEDHSPLACGEGLAKLVVWCRNAASVLSSASRGARILALPQTLTLAYEANGGPEMSCGFAIGDEKTEPYFFARKIGERKPEVLSASQLEKESNPGLAAAQFITA